jgi:hypothetical protein
VSGPPGLELLGPAPEKKRARDDVGATVGLGGLGNRRWWLSFEDQHVALGRCRGEPLPVRVPFDADGWVAGNRPYSRFQCLARNLQTLSCVISGR